MSSRYGIKPPVFSSRTREIDPVLEHVAALRRFFRTEQLSTKLAAKEDEEERKRKVVALCNGSIAVPSLEDWTETKGLELEDGAHDFEEWAGAFRTKALPRNWETTLRAKLFDDPTPDYDDYGEWTARLKHGQNLLRTRGALWMTSPSPITSDRKCQSSSKLVCS